MLCTKCKKYPQINKKYGLCLYCNRKRLHPEEEKNKLCTKTLINNRNSFKSKKKHKIRQQSEKQIEFKKQLSEIYNEIDNEREPICESCGMIRGKLSHSHTISIKKRPDLALDKRNIILECCGQSDFCHEKWESGNIEKMMSLLTFKDKMEYIKEQDEKIYWWIMNKIK